MKSSATHSSIRQRIKRVLVLGGVASLWICPAIALSATTLKEPEGSERVVMASVSVTRLSGMGLCPTFFNSALMNFISNSAL